MDHHLAYACSRVLNVEIKVWKFVGGKWVFLEHLVPPSSKRSKHPMYLFLNHGHFTTLLPSTSAPKKWEALQGGPEKVSYMGGAANQSDETCSEVKSHAG